MNQIYKSIKCCRISSDKKLKKVINFGRIKLTGIFPKHKKKKILSTPLELVYSENSKLLQLKHNYNHKYLFNLFFVTSDIEALILLSFNLLPEISCIIDEANSSEIL